MCNAHDTCFSAGKIRKFFTRGGPVEVVQLCFGTRNVLKFSFDNCRGYAIPVNSCFSAGKIRLSCFHCRGDWKGVFQCLECPKV